MNSSAWRGGSNRNNYANVDLIVKVARTCGADAVWPGWGHASENPQLPSQLAYHDIAFLGPPASAMDAVGDKICANILAQSCDVNVIPWSGRVSRYPARAFRRTSCSKRRSQTSTTRCSEWERLVFQS